MKNMYMFWFFIVSVYSLHVEGYTQPYRLQNDVFPVSYSLKMHPNLDTGNFSGEVTIFVRLDHLMKTITLNSRDLTISKVTLDREYTATEFELDPENQLLHIFGNGKQYISPGEHILHIRFSGTLLRSTGFYKSSTYGGQNCDAVLTKFSSIFARSAFPCFDEPSYKSIFNIRIMKSNYTHHVLSNMKQIASYKTDDGEAVDFQSTVPMSTYLVAFMVTNMSSTGMESHKDGIRIPIQVYSVNGDEIARSNVLQLSANVLNYFIDYTNISYPLPKLDLVEVSEHASSAMENWGLIVFRRNVLLFNSSVHRCRLEHDVTSALVIAHEICHSWFGNLVTHNWYSDLWLTEGICKYLEYKAVDQFYVDLDVVHMFSYNRLYYLYQNMEYMPAREIAHNVRSFRDIFMQYGGTTYSQGAAVVKMLEAAIGELNLQEGLRAYLKRHAYKTATTGDFINAVQLVVPNTNIRNFLESWLFQSGFPLIDITEGTDSYILKQRKFFENELNSTSIYGDRWTIPVSYFTNLNDSSPILVWFDKDMEFLCIPKTSETRWVKLNYKQTGFYRTKYPQNVYNKLYDNFERFSSPDRAHLLEETFHLYNSRELHCSIPLKFMKRLKNSFDYLPTVYTVRELYIFGNSGLYQQSYNDYIVYVFGSHYMNATWIVGESDTRSQRLHRIVVLNLLCNSLWHYERCSEDVKNIEKNNITLHDDVANLYQDVLKRDDSPNQFEYTHRHNECITWIKENLPNFLNEGNEIK